MAKKVKFELPKPSLGRKHKLHWLVPVPKKKRVQFGIHVYACEKPIKTYHFTTRPEEISCRPCKKRVEKMNERERNLRASEGDD